MKSKIIILILIFNLIVNISIIAQVSNTTNNSFTPNAQYAGWDNATGGQLMIKNESNNPINFLTNTGAGGTTPVRMTITGAGNVGIGTTSPNNFLHINGGIAQITNSTTGTGTGDGFLIGQSSSGSSNLELNQQENAPINFLTNGNARFKIQNDGKIFMGPYTAFSANNQLVQYAGANTSVYHQFLMSNTVTSATDGFRIGITNNSGSADAELRQGANAPMNFLTNGTQRMTITSGGDVGIGTTAPVAKFQVDYSTNAGGGTSFGGFVNSAFSGTSNSNYGFTSATNITGISNANYGVYATVVSGTTASGNTSWGVYGLASGDNDDDVAIGGEFVGGGGNQGYGIRAYASTSANINYAVFAAATGSCTSTSSCAAAAGYFSGNLAYTGSLVPPSDASLKINVTPIVNANAIIGSLNPKTYQFDNVQYDYMHLPQGDQFGLIAQELELIYPQFVKNMILPAQYDKQGNMVHPEKAYKGVDYIPLISLLLAGHKELQQQMNDLQTQINNCCGAQQGNNNTGEKTGATDIKLINTNNFILYQNEPNPYTSSTTIRYFIPENVSDVKITFQDASGKNLKEVKLNQTGQGSIAVDGNELNNGLYTYSLIINGKVVDVKKMVKQ